MYSKKGQFDEREWVQAKNTSLSEAHTIFLRSFANSLGVILNRYSQISLNK